MTKKPKRTYRRGIYWRWLKIKHAIRLYRGDGISINVRGLSREDAHKDLDSWIDFCEEVDRWVETFITKDDDD